MVRKSLLPLPEIVRALKMTCFNGVSACLMTVGIGCCNRQCRVRLRSEIEETGRTTHARSTQFRISDTPQIL